MSSLDVEVLRLEPRPGLLLWTWFSNEPPLGLSVWVLEATRPLHGLGAVLTMYSHGHVLFKLQAVKPIISLHSDFLFITFPLLLEGLHVATALGIHDCVF